MENVRLTEQSATDTTEAGCPAPDFALEPPFLRLDKPLGKQ